MLIKFNTPTDYRSWAEMNFGNNDFNDQRLTKRNVIIAEALMTYPNMSISDLFPQSSDAISAYRFFQNSKTPADSVTQTHRNNTFHAIMQLGEQAQAAGEKKPVVLLLGDSSEIILGIVEKSMEHVQLE